MAAEANRVPELSWPTLGAWVGRQFVAMGPAAAGSWHVAIWFVHVYLALFMIAYIPFSKMFHMYAAPLAAGAAARRRFIRTGGAAAPVPPAGAVAGSGRALKS